LEIEEIEVVVNKSYNKSKEVSIMTLGGGDGGRERERGDEEEEEYGELNLLFPTLKYIHLYLFILCVQIRSIKRI
jgi:hypothetical protein